MSDVKNILIVGVGGQGTILASRILGAVAGRLATDVKVSEIHGMSQRGGSVVTQVRFGSRVFAPVIAKGAADVIIAFEKLEALRWAPWLKKGGLMVINEQEINPMPVVRGVASYPEDIYGQLAGQQVLSLPATELARQAGTHKAANVVLLGVLARALNHDESVWLEALEEQVPQRFLSLNREAFRLGYEYH